MQTTKVSYFYFNTLEFLVDMRVSLMKPHQRGELMDKIIKACESGNIKYLKQFSFIETIKTKNAFPKREYIPSYVRGEVLSIGVCLKCGSKDKLSIDHIKPYSKGGSNDIKNLQCLCMPCNLDKGVKTIDYRSINNG